jgi:hypothetical protein
MKNLFALILMLMFMMAGCQRADSTPQIAKENSVKEGQGITRGHFAGGCFWCTEADFEKVPKGRKVKSFAINE